MVLRIVFGVVRLARSRRPTGKSRRANARKRNYSRLSRRQQAEIRFYELLLELLTPFAPEFTGGVTAARTFLMKYNPAGLRRLFRRVFIGREEWNAQGRQEFRKAMAAARTQARRIFRKELKRAITARYRRRTGNLLRVRVRGSGRHTGIYLKEDFPRTEYRTQLGRGLEGGSKNGQYAYVLNNKTRFVEVARRIAGKRIRATTQLNYVRFARSRSLKGTT